MSASVPNGSIISRMVEDRMKALPQDARVLFLRTPTTGGWLDTILVPSHVRVDRVLYVTPVQETFQNSNTAYAAGTRVIADADVLQTLQDLRLGGLYDLVSLDSFHEFDTSLRDMHSVLSLMKPDAVMLAHDCFPAQESFARAKYTPGCWCGLTFAAFIMVAYAYPEAHFCVLQPDTGIGMLSKTKQEFSSPRDERFFAEFTALLSAALLDQSPISSNRATSALWKFVKKNGHAFSGLITA